VLDGIDPVRPSAAQAQATLSDGRVFAIGGSWNGGYSGQNGIPIKNGEVRRSQLLPVLPLAVPYRTQYTNPSCNFSRRDSPRLVQTYHPCTHGAILSLILHGDRCSTAPRTAGSWRTGPCWRRCSPTTRRQATRSLYSFPLSPCEASRRPALKSALDSRFAHLELDRIPSLRQFHISEHHSVPRSSASRQQRVRAVDARAVVDKHFTVSDIAV